MVEIYARKQGELTRCDSFESGCWINVYPPFTHELLDELSRDYEIPLVFLTDSLDIDERSRFEEDEGMKLLVLNTPIPNEEDIVVENPAMFITIPIGVIIGDDFVLTISGYTNPVIDSFLNKRVKNFDPSNKTLFILQLLDRNVFYFLHYLKQINNRRNIFEEELFNSSRNKELTQLMDLQKSLIYFVNTLRSNEMVMNKMLRVNFLGTRGNEDLHDMLQDIIIDNGQAMEMSNVYTNIINGTMDSFASIISNNLNMVLRRLTSITIILMVPTLIASFYGMNIELPFQHNPAAFALVIFLSIFSSVILTWFFMRKKWF